MWGVHVVAIGHVLVIPCAQSAGSCRSGARIGPRLTRRSGCTGPVLPSLGGRVCEPLPFSRGIPPAALLSQAVPQMPRWRFRPRANTPHSAA